MTRALACWCLAALALDGCYSGQLDPDATGVFACSAGDPRAACPEGQTCVNQRCERTTELPVLSVLSPEDEHALTVPRGFDPLGGVPEEPPLELTVQVRGTLELVRAKSGVGHVFGEGHVAVFVDGEPQRVLDAGDLSRSAPVEIRVVPRVGPHRIELRARRNDGVDYDHPGARATRLFWLEERSLAGRRPFVAIKSPWPGEPIDADRTELELELAVLNFSLADPDLGQRPATGHAHVHYNDVLPTCTLDPQGCDEDYLDEVTSSARASIALPASADASASLSAVLRTDDHGVYDIPLGCGFADPDPTGPCTIAFDTIGIVRRGP